MVKKEELTQIVKTVQKDKGQFELLYSQIINKVYFWCYTILGNDADASDATQEAMIRIYKKLDSLEDPEMFLSWMYRLVRNNSLTYIRLHKKNDLEFLYDDSYKESFENVVKDNRKGNLPSEAYNSKEVKQVIVNLIDQLPRKQKEVITLYYLEEYKINEIAEILDYNSGSVKSRLHAGRKSLESHIKEYEEQNNVKLYSATGLVALLGILINDYYQAVISNQNLAYDKELYDAKNISNTGSTSGSTAATITGSIITTKTLIIAIVVIACISIAAIVLSNSFQNTAKTEITEIPSNHALLNNIEMYEKLKGHPYIEDITYLSFPTRTSTDVSIILKDNIDEEQIQIIFNDNELIFDKKEKDILVLVQENGIYTIVINGLETTFEIEHIDQYAPELAMVKNYGNYTQLIVKDVNHQFDYDESFVECQGKRYEISDGLKVYGVLKGQIEITLFNKEGDFIIYVYDFN
ncbi:RNA polymerase sigma factor [Breznakia pachnodae]|uniref:RNA polymerase sigma factor (Sigma-70 family) n=1 Tax=Breznakia pachnodae TaxID=265178 RepID=A0ABU0E866_9FIRM|nr:RNA polymerase sigma factor [Breznakia pachnodae]MDQ0363070.1 RNA polymerase sigma factor (sigma-70 family) [Breznakia pachnodae]